MNDYYMYIHRYLRILWQTLAFMAYFVTKATPKWHIKILKSCITCLTGYQITGLTLLVEFIYVKAVKTQKPW